MPPKIVPGPAPRNHRQTQGGIDNRNLCLCGQRHGYKNCFNLNPSIRPPGWIVNKGMIMNINSKLRSNSDLRKVVLALGYEFYDGGYTTVPSSQPSRCVASSSNQIVRRIPGSQQLQVVAGNQPARQMKASTKTELQFEKMPVEILTKILEFAYADEVYEFPSFHPFIHNERTLRPALQKKRMFVPKKTSRFPPRNSFAPKNRIPPADLTKKQRKSFLWRNPGVWARPFEIMYASKTFYTVAIPIRYKEVHVDVEYLNGFTNEGLDLVCERLSNRLVLQERTKHLHLTLVLDSYDHKIRKSVEALKSLPKLKHLCITIKYIDVSVVPTLSLLKFFDLKLETLTFIWFWGGPQSSIDTSTYAYDEDYAPVPSIAEDKTQAYRKSWMDQIYKPSRWYVDKDEYDPVRLEGKAKMFHDFTATRRSLDPGYSQWDMDTFVFSIAGQSTPRHTPRPLWNLWQEPHNHPDQLDQKELRRDRGPLREWRKGWYPYANWSCCPWLFDGTLARSYNSQSG